MKNTFLIIIISVFIAFSHTALGSHIVGGELSYRCKGAQNYEFNLSLYTECGSSVILEKYYSIRFFSESLGIPLGASKSFRVTKAGEEEVSFYCDGATTNCKGGSLRGIKRVRYTGNLNMGDFPPAKDWVFFWQKSSRSEFITTLLAPEAEDYYTQVLMNNQTVKCNNSPIFKSSPIFTACMNVETIFSNIAEDPDGDQLVFKLLSPKSSFGEEVIYNNGYDFDNFVKLTSPARIGTATGDITFKATLQEIGITDVLVEEYRDKELISSMTRGLQITTTDCSNEVPEISNFSLFGTSEFTTCAGGAVIDVISAVDADGEPLTMTLLSGRSDIFEIHDNGTPNPKVKIEWITSPEDVGTHLFTIRVDDGVCPKPGIATKTFTITLLPSPKISFDKDTLYLNCNDDPVTVTPKVTGGDGFYSYAWSSKKWDPAVVILPQIQADTGVYTLEVKDGKRCKAKKKLVVLPSIGTLFFDSIRCFGQPTYFLDLSWAEKSKIKSWEWDFGDSTSSTVKNPVHRYAAPGKYDVILTVTDDSKPACSSTDTVSVSICDGINTNLRFNSGCSGDSTFIILKDTSDIACSSYISKISYGDGKKDSIIFSDSIPHIYGFSGDYNVTIDLKSISGCSTRIAGSAHVYRRPHVKISPETSFLDCNDPNSILSTTIIPGDGGNIKYFWNTHDTTTAITVKEEGDYWVEVEDDNGCTWVDFATKYFPLNTKVHFDPFCKPGDVLKFRNRSFFHHNVLSWEWDFGDGTSFSGQHPPAKRYASTTQDYEVKLLVTDEKGCKDSTLLPVYHQLIDSSFFDVTPNNASICVKDAVNGIGPEGAHINEYIWDFGDGQFRSGKNVYAGYGTEGDYEVKLKVTYNRLDGMNNGCQSDFSEGVTIFPELNASINTERICQDILSTYSFTRIAGDLDIPIITAEWDFGDGSPISKEFKPQHAYDNIGFFDVTLQIEDSLGCKKTIKEKFRAEKVSKPDFLFDQTCGNDLVSFTLNFRDTLENISHYQWVFNTKDTLTGVWAPPPVTGKALGRDTLHQVSLSVSNEFSKCNQETTKTIKTLPLPLANFEMDTSCAGVPVQFRNTSTAIKSSPIIGYEWTFHDGTTSKEENAVKVYERAGLYPVSLVAFNSLNCTDTLSQNILIQPSPEARFRTLDPFVEAFVPTQFLDDSDGNIISYQWDFGDGATSTEENPIHTYDTIKVYHVRLIVTNNFGCTDTTVVRTDLNVHLDLPSAFSPNGDTENDQLKLIHNGIKELYEFKIYNRWGQLVFDAHDVGKEWDGTFKGHAQDAGVYVAHIKAKGAYDVYFNFKKNVTLLR